MCLKHVFFICANPDCRQTLSTLSSVCVLLCMTGMGSSDSGVTSLSDLLVDEEELLVELVGQVLCAGTVQRHQLHVTRGLHPFCHRGLGGQAVRVEAANHELIEVLNTHILAVSNVNKIFLNICLQEKYFYEYHS